MQIRAGRGLRLKIAVGVVATIIAVATVDFIVDYHVYSTQVMEDIQESSLTLARTTLQMIVELAMLGEHPHLLQQGIERLVEEQGDIATPMRAIEILDDSGAVHFSSIRANLGRLYDRGDDGCRQCHFAEASSRPTLVFHTNEGGEVLRTVTLIPNRPECHSCHSASDPVVGVLLIDYSIKNRWSKLEDHLGSMVINTGATSVALILVLGLLMNRLVISRVKALTLAAVNFAKDRSPSRFEPLRSDDEVGALAEAFGRMALELGDAIRRSEQQKGYLEGLMESIQYGLVVVDRENRIEMRNPAARATWEETLQVGLALFETPLATLEGAVNTTKTQREVVHLDKELQTERGLRPFEVSCSPVLESGESVDRVILLFHDLTERYVLQQQVSRAERLASVGQLAAGVAHEINNPMAAISTCAEGLDRYLKRQGNLTPNDMAEVSDYLSTIGEAALRCKEITQRLLSLSSEPVPADLQKTGLAGVTLQVLLLVEHEARARAIEVKRVLDPDCNVTGDPKELFQLVLNLLLNSIEATPPGGKVAVLVEPVDGRAVLTVEDNGVGIPEDELERLFDPFFSSNRQGSGTGLGLAVCESIVRRHDGDIRIQSVVGEGTSVRVELPLVREGS